MSKRNIVLIGMMGTGKSTVGVELARRLGFAFVDTDERIEREQGMSIKDIFAQRGEPAFRQLESETIASVLEAAGQIVATGGGAVLSGRNREVMASNGYVVALTATAETIIHRVSTDQNRPLLQGDVEERVRTIMESRKHAYDFADLKIETDGRTVEEIVNLVMNNWLAWKN